MLLRRAPCQRRFPDNRQPQILGLQKEADRASSCPLVTRISGEMKRLKNGLRLSRAKRLVSRCEADGPCLFSHTRVISAALVKDLRFLEEVVFDGLIESLGASLA